MAKKLKPLGPNHPVIVDINGQINDLLNDVKWRYGGIKTRLDNIDKQSGDPGKLTTSLTSYESASGNHTNAAATDVTFLRRDMQDIAEMAAHAVTDIERIGVLTRRKLRLFEDVDFPGGHAEIVAIRTAEGEDEEKRPAVWNKYRFRTANPRLKRTKHAPGPFWDRGLAHEWDEAYAKRYKEAPPVEKDMRTIIVVWVQATMNWGDGFKTIEKFWPDAKEIHKFTGDYDAPEFNDNTPKPEWWNP